MLLWVALALAHFIFRPSVTLFHADVAAWIVFGSSLLISGLPRWLYEIEDTEIIGPFRLWLAAATVALLFCMTSSFIAAPKIKAVQLQLSATGISGQQRLALIRSREKTLNFSAQFLCIRMALAMGMAFGLKKLPRKTKAD